MNIRVIGYVDDKNPVEAPLPPAIAQQWCVRLGLNPASAGRTYGSVSTQDRTHGVGERLQALPKESRRRSKRSRALEVESPILVSLLESVFERERRRALKSP